jgi:hypothetical protein
VGSSSSLRLPGDQPSAKHRAFASARSPPKRKRSISDSLVSTGSKKLEEDEDEIDEMYIEEEQHYDYGVETRSDTRPDNTQPRAEEDDDDESDGFVESGEEGDEGQPDLDTGSLSRAARLQGHESGPPSPPANYYQHGSTPLPRFLWPMQVTIGLILNLSRSERESGRDGVLPLQVLPAHLAPEPLPQRAAVRCPLFQLFAQAQGQGYSFSLSLARSLA